jgi:hypothetical protein
MWLVSDGWFDNRTNLRDLSFTLETAAAFEHAKLAHLRD